MTDYPKIVVTPPGPKARELVKKDEKFISPSYGRFYPLVVESGKGCIVKDVDGNEYIDFNSGLVCLGVGHNHPKVVSAMFSMGAKMRSIEYSRVTLEDVFIQLTGRSLREE
jgi:4-aminobutyrate aminotransferase